MDSKTISYTAANSIPVKIFKSEKLVADLIGKYIPPVHAQIIPTNRCNLNCSFCSCKKRDKKEELSLDQIGGLCDTLKQLGCKAATVTGGGEPLMHKDISLILSVLHNHDIKIGLVTNGLLLDKLTADDFAKITWCRISCCDERKGDDKTFEIIDKATRAGKKVDWAFSYVISQDFDPSNLNRYINFANVYNFTHVRVVSDLCNLDSVGEMDNIKNQVTVDDRLVVYQGRKNYDTGQKDCRISLLKPVIGADGKIYPCCGVQYAHEEQDLDMPASMCMGGINDLRDIYENQQHFNGLQCNRCYYKNYNDILSQMIEPTEHLDFV